MEVSYYSSSNTLFAKEKFTRYENFTNGTRHTFKYKTVVPPRETQKVVFEIVDATPLD